MSAAVTLYGASYSVYVRAVRMALAAKRVAYDLQPVDIFSAAEDHEAYRKLHPFGRIPAFRHDDFVLYETAAINRYVDEAFSGPALQPAKVADRARMVQVMAMTDSYGYRPLVWDIYVERVSQARDGKPVDEKLIAAALPKARTYLSALDALKGDMTYLVSAKASLADFHVAPVFGYFLQAPEGRQMLSEFPRLARWWESISAMPEWSLAVAE
ncbi:glutathione S-transferase family protein [Taklimakanibacter lacteus]|uniref:glutathione S-transferase family protein n=1 Tax=Taklimakanibacter lacteus TaxID=2268456 RepID=UPI0034D5A7A7